VANHGYLPLWVWKPRTDKGTRFTLLPANIEPEVIDSLEMSMDDRSKMTQFLLDTRVNLDGHGEIVPIWLN